MVRTSFAPAAGPFQRSAADAPSKLYWIQLLLRRRIGSHLRQAALGYDDTRRNRLSVIENSNSDLFSWRCRVARCPIRGNAIRTQTGGTRGSPRDLAPASSHMGPFSLLRRSPDFQHLVDYGIARTSLDRRSMPPVTALMRRVRMDVEVALSWATAGKYARNVGRLDLL